MSSGLLDGRVAVITGAASGMGRAAARTFVDHGASVLLADIQESAVAEVSNGLGNAAVFVRTDVTVEDDLAAAVDSAVRHFGKLDVMFSNAGSPGDLSPIDQLSTEGLDRTLRTNLYAHATAHKYAARQFRNQGTGGSIITTASIAAQQAGWNGPAYSMAKAAVMALVRQTALENKGSGIRSNAILPGAVMTSIIAKMFEVNAGDEDCFLDRVGAAISSENLIGRPGRAVDIANAALFLASDLSSWVTGTGVTVDGGVTAYTKDATVELITGIAQDFV